MLIKKMLIGLGCIAVVGALTVCAVVPMVKSKKVEVKNVEIIHETKFNSSYVKLTNEDMLIVY